MATGDEIPLQGGRNTSGVVKIGDSVRRPARQWTATVHALLEHLHAVGFSGSPVPLGFDEQGREKLAFVEGKTAGDPLPPWASSARALASVAQLQRRLHEAMRTFQIPEGAIWQQPFRSDGVLGHNDFCPSNVVFRNGLAVGIIDFDTAGPTPEFWDLASAMRHWVPVKSPEDVGPLADDNLIIDRFKIYRQAYGLRDEDRPALYKQLTSLIEQAIGSLSLEKAGESWATAQKELLERSLAWLQLNRSPLLAD